MRSVRHAQVLSDSRLSKTVFKVSKGGGKAAAAAKVCVDKWRALCAPSTTKPVKTKTEPKADSAAEAGAPAVKAEATTGAKDATSNGASTVKAEVKPENSTRSTGSRLMPTGDSVRDSVRQKFQGVFEKGMEDNAAMLREHDTDTAEMAVEAELAMYEKFGSSSCKEYKARFRTLMFNLKDPKNPEFILSVVSGQLHVNDLSAMDVKEMASSEVKKQRQKWMENSKMSLMDEKTYNKYTGKQLQDGILKCPKCKSLKTEYVEVQTRSADEPTTKKCLCNNCNYRWKFC